MSLSKLGVGGLDVGDGSARFAAGTDGIGMMRGRGRGKGESRNVAQDRAI